MRVIIGTTSFDAAAQAKETLEAKYKHEKSRGSLPLIGVAEHLALHPVRCDDCTETYWSQDQWSSTHPGCKGLKKNMGF